MTGKIFDFIIGAGEGSNLIVDDEYMSTRHARFIGYDDGTVTIEDLGTNNGTWVNGMRVYGPWKLNPGDKIRIGHTDIPIPDSEQLMRMFPTKTTRV